MKACKLCEIFDHQQQQQQAQQKSDKSGGNDKNITNPPGYTCNHNNLSRHNIEAQLSQFNQLLTPNHLRDVFLAAQILRGEIYITYNSFLFSSFFFYYLFFSFFLSTTCVCVCMFMSTRESFCALRHLTTLFFTTT